MPDEKRQILKVNCPSNANSDRNKTQNPPEKEEKRVQKVVKGKVIKKKKSAVKRFFETFIGEDINDVGTYIIQDVLIPAARDTLYDMVMGSLGLSLYGDRRGVRGGRRDNRSRSSYTSYDKYSNRDDRDRRDRREMPYKSRATHDFDSIVLESKAEAEAVIYQLVDIISDYGWATVKDLYESVDVESSFTDEKYGWDDLSSATSSRTRDGWVLNLPRPIVVE